MLRVQCTYLLVCTLQLHFDFILKIISTIRNRISLGYIGCSNNLSQMHIRMWCSWWDFPFCIFWTVGNIILANITTVRTGEGAQINHEKCCKQDIYLPFLFVFCLKTFYLIWSQSEIDVWLEWLCNMTTKQWKIVKLYRQSILVGQGKLKSVSRSTSQDGRAV